MSKPRTWTELAQWTFKNAMTPRTVGGAVLRREEPRSGYAYPDDPTMIGEVLLRGIAEGA